MACRICHSRRRRDYFHTGRLAICHPCIDLLNTTPITPTAAGNILDDYLRGRLKRWDADSLAKPDQRQEWQLLKAAQRWNDPALAEDYFQECQERWLADIIAGRDDRYLHGDQLKAVGVLRAVDRGLLLHSRVWENYPPDWEEKRRRIWLEDRLTCRLCGTHGVQVHAHHIVFRSRGGRHDLRNLVTLCLACHQEQHPSIVISGSGGEPAQAPVFEEALLSFRNEQSPQRVLFSRAPLVLDVPIPASTPRPLSWLARIRRFLHSLK